MHGTDHLNYVIQFFSSIIYSYYELLSRYNDLPGDLIIIQIT